MEQPEIGQLFEQINEHRVSINEKTKNLQEEIVALQNEISILIAPHAEAIDALKLDIETAVLINEVSVKTDAGTCTYVKGRKGAVKWDNAALMGYVSAAPENEAILQFRSEKPDGQPGTRFKFIDL